jgi:hypothetical protein
MNTLPLSQILSRSLPSDDASQVVSLQSVRDLVTTETLRRLEHSTWKFLALSWSFLVLVNLEDLVARRIPLGQMLLFFIFLGLPLAYLSGRGHRRNVPLSKAVRLAALTEGLNVFLAGAIVLFAAYPILHQQGVVPQNLLSTPVPLWIFVTIPLLALLIEWISGGTARRADPEGPVSAPERSA